MRSVISHVLALAPPADVDPSTGKGPEWGKAAPVGLLVILLLCIAVFFLLRSMVRRINKVPGEFEARAHDASEDGQIGSNNLSATEPPVIGRAPDGAPEPEPGSPGLVEKHSG